MRGVGKALVDDCEVVEITRNDLEPINNFKNTWQFPKPRHCLGTVLDSRVVRPLSPTLKVQ